MSVCLSVPKDLAYCFADMVLFFSIVTIFGTLKNGAAHLKPPLWGLNYFFSQLYLTQAVP